MTKSESKDTNTMINILELENITVDMLGRYKCIVSNPLGKTEKKLNIRGISM